MTQMILDNCPFCGGKAKLINETAIYVACTECGARSRQITKRVIVGNKLMREKYGRIAPAGARQKEIELHEREIQAERDRCVTVAVEAWNRRNI